MARVTHFDISAKDPEKLIPFYQDVFEWTFHKWEGPMDYWLITTGPASEGGIDGGLAVREENANTVNTIEVQDLDATVAKLKSAGAKIKTERMAIPGIGWYAQFFDPEGNEFGLMQSDESAG